jgi:hypothetical protein
MTAQTLSRCVLHNEVFGIRALARCHAFEQQKKALLKIWSSILFIRTSWTQTPNLLPAPMNTATSGKSRQIIGTSVHLISRESRMFNRSFPTLTCTEPLFKTLT